MNANQQKVDTTSPSADGQRCRLCQSFLDLEEGDDFTVQLCNSCKGRPEARRILAFPSRGAQRLPSASAREFTPAERSLIQKVHGFMPAAQLLSILNERLACDLGPDAQPYTMDQLRSEVGESVSTNGEHDWGSLRKVLASARRSGVLAAITPQMIDDFAVVYSLTPRHVLRLKDVLLQTEEED